MNLPKNVEDVAHGLSDQRRSAEKSKGKAVVIKNSEAEKAYVLWTFDKSCSVAEDTS